MQRQASELAYPPSVISGEAQLNCDIDSRKNGVQKLSLTAGGGLEFDAVVSPMIDGTVELKGPEKGGLYRFTSHLAQPAHGELSGVGPVTITQMDTKVTVALDRYQQKGGPGTELSFTTPDMSRRGIYVEFAGLASADNGDKYTFRINLGSPTFGSGKVRPAGPNYHAEMMAKSVVVHAPATTVVETVPVTTTVRSVR